tara:strand:+ start:1405 stop:2364 length:960 start_codon:yes stop_codon:yes gene_type:complete
MFCSIIIPFNKIEKYFDKCLKSLANQSIDKKLYEVILINDNCNFKSSNLLNKFLNKNKNFILIYNKQKTIGPGYARNIGIKEAKGKYIYFLDSDDYLTKNTLLNLYNLTLKKKPDLICNDFQVIDKVGNLKKRKRFDLKLLTNTKKKILIDFFNQSIIPQVISNLILKKLIKKNKIRFLDGYYEDVYFFFRVLFYSKKKIIFNKKLYIKHNIEKSIINSLSKRHIIDSFFVYQNCYKFLLKKSRNFEKKILQYYFIKSIIGQTAVNLMRIRKYKLQKKQKKSYNKLVYKLLMTYFDKFKVNYIFITKKDKLVRNFITKN